MRYILLLLALTGCQIIHDIQTPTVPSQIQAEMWSANDMAAQILTNLDTWIEDPVLIPSDAVVVTRAQITYILARLNVVQLWMLHNNVEGGVTQTVVDLQTAWEDYIYNHFCKGGEAWLATKVRMSADDTYAWHQVFAKLNKLHEQVHTWMTHKGIMENEQSTRDPRTP